MLRNSTDQRKNGRHEPGALGSFSRTAFSFFSKKKTRTTIVIKFHHTINFFITWQSEIQTQIREKQRKTTSSTYCIKKWLFLPFKIQIKPKLKCLNLTQSRAHIHFNKQTFSIVRVTELPDISFSTLLSLTASFTCWTGLIKNQ